MFGIDNEDFNLFRFEEVIDTLPVYTGAFQSTRTIMSLVMVPKVLISFPSESNDTGSNTFFVYIQAATVFIEYFHINSLLLWL